jgi:hypothetical protein
VKRDTTPADFQRKDMKCRPTIQPDSWCRSRLFDPDDAGPLADAALVFSSGPCEGCQLVGFSVWRNKRGSGVNVTFPSRAYTNAKGQKRTFSFIQAGTRSLAGFRALIIAAYEAATQRAEG